MSEIAFRRQVAHVRLAGLMWTTTLMGAGAGLLSHIVLARHLGPDGYAPLALVLATASILTPLALFGMGSFLVRTASPLGRVPPSLLRATFGLNAALATALGGLGMAWLVNLGGVAAAQPLSIIILPLVLASGMASLTEAIFQVERLQGAVLVWQSVPNGLRLAAMGVLLLFGFSMAQAGVALAIAALGVIVISLGLSVPRLRRAAGSDLPRHWGAIAKGSWPFALSSIIYGVLLQSGTLIVAHLRPSEETAIISLAVTGYLVFHVLAGALSQKLLHPRFSRWRADDPLHLKDMFGYAQARMLAAGCVLAVIGWLAAPILVPQVLGAGLRAVVGPLSILLIAAPFRFVASVSSAMLNSGISPPTKTGVDAIGMICTVVLAVLLVADHGPRGAAIALTAGEIVIAVLMTTAVRFLRWKSVP